MDISRLYYNRQGTDSGVKRSTSARSGQTAAAGASASGKQTGVIPGSDSTGRSPSLDTITISKRLETTEAAEAAEASETEKAAETTEATESQSKEAEQSATDKRLEDKLDRLTDMVNYLEQMDSAQQQADAAAEEYGNMGKCLEISRRIMKGDRVPIKDVKFLQEKQPKLYKMAIMLKKTSKHPKKHKSLLEKEKDEGRDSSLTDEMKTQLRDLSETMSGTGAESSGSSDSGESSESEGGEAAGEVVEG